MWFTYSWRWNRNCFDWSFTFIVDCITLENIQTLNLIQVLIVCQVGIDKIGDTTIDTNAVGIKSYCKHSTTCKDIRSNIPLLCCMQYVLSNETKGAFFEYTRETYKSFYIKRNRYVILVSGLLRVGEAGNSSYATLSHIIVHHLVYYNALYEEAWWYVKSYIYLNFWFIQISFSVVACKLVVSRSWPTFSI